MTDRPQAQELKTTDVCHLSQCLGVGNLGVSSPVALTQASGDWSQAGTTDIWKVHAPGHHTVHRDRGSSLALNEQCLLPGLPPHLLFSSWLPTQVLDYGQQEWPTISWRSHLNPGRSSGVSGGAKSGILGRRISVTFTVIQWFDYKVVQGLQQSI